MASAMSFVLSAGFVASAAWFVVGSILYMNPLVAAQYRKETDSPGFRTWTNTGRYLLLTYLFTLVQTLLWAGVFWFIRGALPATAAARIVAFAVILIATKIIPRFLDMWIQSTYPLRLLVIELINGSIGSVVVAAVYTLMLRSS